MDQFPATMRVPVEYLNKSYLSYAKGVAASATHVKY